MSCRVVTEMVTGIAVFCIRERNKVGAAHILVSLVQILGGVERGVVELACQIG